MDLIILSIFYEGRGEGLMKGGELMILLLM